MRLADVDLVHVDCAMLISVAQVYNAPTSASPLDGANLSGADLSFTSLRGAWLQAQPHKPMQNRSARRT